MASQGYSRKRPAPGANPIGYSQQMPQQQPNNMYAQNVGQGLSDDQFLQWGNSGVPQSYESNTGYGYAQPTPQSTQLARRPVSQQAMTRAAVKYENAGNQQWPDQNGAQSTLEGPWSDDIQDLEAKAQVAKKEAQSKRKQIPPFVQKLNSFLEDGKNTDLIRWSDDGNSFVVLDEDEFAKTLIPELFKHNNYASFVRQLNMYGFHKKVGLSDNSMKASERKNKSPSEYSNPYFRRGHPDLLWLIQKPKTTSTKKGKKTDGDQVDDDIDEYVEEVPVPDTRIRQRPQLTLGHGESTLSQEQFSSIQRELQTIKSNQAQIHRMMTNLKREHEQLYGQANNFQDQHSRHENSINAILTFLATVYNRSLQGHEGVQGIQNLFSSTGAIPGEQASGTVVDVGDYSFDHAQPESTPNKPFRKAPLLITDGSQQGRASTMSPSTANSPFPPRQSRRPSQTYRTTQTPQPAVEELFDSGDTPVQTMPSQQDIMNVINDTNARNSTPNNDTDFSNMISDLQNSGGNNPLNPAQRADMLRMINNTGGNKTNGDNALINTTPPPYPNSFNRGLANSKANYDSLAKMQAEQDKSVQNLTNLLQPLSPSGSIPGIHDDTSLPPAPWNVDDFLNADQGYFDSFGSDGANFDLNNTDDSIAAPAFNDYDDMFSGVPNPTNDNQASNTNDTLTTDENNRGRVESASIASSEVATPESAVSTSNSPITRTKGRLQTTTEDTQPPKRTRRG